MPSLDHLESLQHSALILATEFLHTCTPPVVNLLVSEHPSMPQPSQSSQASKNALGSRFYSSEEIEAPLDPPLEQSAKTPGGNFPPATYDAAAAHISSSYGKRKRATHDDAPRSPSSRHSKHTVSSSGCESTTSTSAGAALAVSISGMSNAMSAMSTSLHEASINSSHTTLKSVAKFIEEADTIDPDDKNILHFYYSNNPHAAIQALAMAEGRLRYWRWLLRKLKSNPEFAGGAGSS